MKHYNPITHHTQNTTPFDNSEEAWFWCCLCESLGCMRGKGGHRTVVRPCESSDIIIAVKRLLGSGIISQEHAQILSKYGMQQMPPHPNFGDSPRICKLWNEALDFLNNILKQKGIVA